METASKSYISVPWSGVDISFGSGYNIMERQLKTSALQPFKAVKDDIAPTLSPESYIIATEDELNAKIKSEVSASVPLDGATIGASGGFLSKVKISDKSMLQVIRMTIKGPNLKAKDADLKLTSQAIKLLEGPDGPKRFAEQYGHYFVYACERKASFTATCTFTSSCSETLNKLKSSLSIDAANVAKATQSAEATLAKNSEKVWTNIKMDIIGYDPSKKHPKVANLTEIATAYELFQEYAEPVPYMASLRHYSTIDPRIPSPSDQFKDLSKDLSNALQRIYMLQSEVVSSPMVRAAELSKPISEAASALLELAPGNAAALAEWSKKVDGIAADVNKWKLRDQLLKDVKKLTSKDYLSYNEYIEAFGRPHWAQGIMVTPDHPVWGPIAGDILHTRKDWQVEWQFAVAQTKKVNVGSHDRVIIGWQVNSGWTDSTNGYFKLIKGNVLEQEMDVGFRSYGTTGANWNFQVWSVDKALYERHEAF